MEALVFFALPLALYAVLAAALAMRTRAPRRRFFLLVTLIAVVWAGGIVAFWWFASEFRVDGAAFDEWVTRARAAFLALYAALLALSYVLGRVLGLGRSGIVAASAFVLATAYHVEYLNACFVGKPVVWPGYISCG